MMARTLRGTSMRLKEGQEFAGFTVVRKLGRGGMASVYLATEPGFARQIGLMPPRESSAEKAVKGAFNAATKVRRAIADRRSSE